MLIRGLDMRSNTGVELGNQPGDRTARRPLAVGPAIAGRHLDRHYREAPLRFGRQRCRGNGICALNGPNARA